MLNELEHLAPPPANLDEEALAAWEASFEHDKQIWGDLLAANLDLLERGSRSLHWTDTTGSHWGTKVAPSSRGLTYNDINRPKAYGTVPDRSESRNLTPRGAVRAPYEDRMPVLEDYTLLDKYELWADNVSTLYEEAKSRQWNSTTDIPWSELEPASEDLEKAACQLATFLTDVEFVAGGGGLLHVSPSFEWALKAILEAPSHTTGTYLLNVLGEGFVLSCFRAGEFLARTTVDREIFRRCLQDEARHVAYGTMELKSYLEHHPDPAVAHERMHRFADVGELVLLSGMTDPCLLEPVAVLMGGSIAAIDEGFEGIAFLWTTVREEYLQRCDRAGFDRRTRCKIPESIPEMN